MIIRRWQPEVDHERLSGFEASYSSDHCYQVVIKGMSVELVKAQLARPLTKVYSPESIKESIAGADLALVAEIGHRLGGLATVKYEAWNNRANLTGIYVAPENKGKGVGRALVAAVMIEVQEKRARCLFVETQNVNYPAIRFYRKMNFEFCGFDTSLYNPDQVSANETAFYFCHNLSDEDS
jgi:ribosomal protein S18 acetylase RimI-like enzyme